MGNRKRPGAFPLVLLLLFVTAPSLSGCVAAALTGVAAGAAVAGTAVYEDGKQTTVHQASLDRTWNATLATVRQMNWQVEKQNKTAQGGTLEAKRADGTPITITEEPINGNKETRVIVRVGTMGDQAASEDIQRRISSRLG